MHELGVTQSLLDLAIRHANEAGAVRINQLYVVIGELASIVDDSVQFYWDMITQSTIANGSKLNFKRIPATLRCNACGTESPLNRSEYVCSACGSDKLVVVGGQEFYLESIDVDLAQPEEKTPNA